MWSFDVWFPWVAVTLVFLHYLPIIVRSLIGAPHPGPFLPAKQVR